MVKGVHNKIIEINETGSDCFERVILFVRPDKQSADNSWLQARALGYIRNLRLRKGIVPGRGLGATLFKYALALSAGAVITALFLSFYH